ncbi:MAG: aminoglycoside phosphotransferase family protein [Deltaproteobacteria bacterium]
MDSRSATSFLPAVPEEITTQWLTTAVAGRYPEARARKVEVVDAHSGTTGRAQIRVEWQGLDTPAASIFVKLPPTNEISRQMVLATGMGRREARFYQHVASAVPVRVPQPLFAQASDDGAEYIMLLEDLNAAGCTFPGTNHPDLLTYAGSLMCALGRLHAHYRGTQAAHAELAFIEGPMRNDWGQILIKSALEQFATEMPPEFGELGRLYLDANQGFQAILEEGVPTLIHGDPHLGNLFVDGDEVGFLDWACTCRSNGVRDVAYFSCNSLPTALRREHEGALLSLYRDSLATGGVVLDAAAIREDYRRYAAYAWLAAVTTLAAGDRMQSIEVGRRATARANSALRDLGTVDYFRDRL